MPSYSGDMSNGSILLGSSSSNQSPVGFVGLPYALRTELKQKNVALVYHAICFRTIAFLPLTFFCAVRVAEVPALLSHRALYRTVWGDMR
jgi:hypothetical protein